MIIIKDTNSNFSQWKIVNSPVGESCPGNTGTVEKCAQPVIPNCVDRNVYCTLPPSTPKEARLDELYRPLTDWNNVPDTK